MTRVTEKGQVTIPKRIREEMGIQPGDEITFEKTDAGYVVRREIEEDRFEKWRGAGESDTSVPERMAELRGRRDDDSR